MRTHALRRPSVAMWLVALAACLVPSDVWAQPPVVKTVPWVANNPLIPHDTWSGKSIRLKGTTDVQGAPWVFKWDFGDGTSTAEATVANRYILEAAHVYNGPVGTIFTATLTVRNTLVPGDIASRNYFVEIRPKNLETEVNVAIDEGLWFLHKDMDRVPTCDGLPCGDWNGTFAEDAATVNAFEVNGHLEGGNPDNPYVETVQRGLRRVFDSLAGATISNQTIPNEPPIPPNPPTVVVNPDSNGNARGLFVNGAPFYESGIVIDAIVASGTPDAIAQTGHVATATSPGTIGRKYVDIVQDIVDYYAFCQEDSGIGTGGWQYSCNVSSDNSAAQWGAIGIIAAEDFGAVVPAFVRRLNRDFWTINSQAADGSFGYTNTAPVWNPWATTPSGMVQLAMDGVGRGNPRWDKAETFLRNNWHYNTNSLSSDAEIRNYYYGLFAFTKAMLLHDPDGDGHPNPITLLQSSTPLINPIDWYAAEATPGPEPRPNADPNNVDGVARTLVNAQAANGSWTGHSRDSRQTPFETPWAIIMLNRTLFSAGAPVAVIAANPNPAVAFQTIQLDGGGSFHQDPTKSIVTWEWDLNNDGLFIDATGPTATVSFPAVGTYIVRLRVTDDGTPSASDEASLTIDVDTPPIAPTADAGGPYNFCAIPGVNFFLDGTGSSNPDEGQSEPGQPANTIIEYAWDLDNDGQFDDAVGSQPNVTPNFPGVGSFLVQLRVTDNTAASYPSSGQPNLTDSDSAQIIVRAATDPACVCATLTARAKPGEVQVNWTAVAGAAGYNIYRSTINGGPYALVASVPSTQLLYINRGLANLTTYHYVVRPAALNGSESCQSNQASATPRTR